MILSDRINDLFQNYSICGDNCDYVSFNSKNILINYICRIKQNISEELVKGNFVETITGAFLYSNFDIVICYYIFFFGRKIQ